MQSEREICKATMSKTNDPGVEIDRRQALQVLARTAAATVSLPVLSEGAKGGQSTPETREAESATRPKFFNRDELQLVDALSEVIIPADSHSPGARAAQVAAFADELLSQSSEKTKQLWRQGLAQIESLANAQYGRTFLACSTAEQVALMHLISENEGSPKKLQEQFFADLKRATVDGYYRSAIGIHKDLQYQGNKHRLAFSGCDQ
jgi:Gluconate 2-dehydrogenase subunit 3